MFLSGALIMIFNIWKTIVTPEPVLADDASTAPAAAIV